MKIAFLIPLFGCATAVAAPPVVGPGGLTPQQVIAHRQGVDIGARHSAAQSVAGSRADEYSAMSPGSSQARFLFNSTVMDAIGQSSNQSGLPSANNLSSAYISFIEKDVGTNANDKVPPNPFASKVEKSQVQGMVFLNSTQVLPPASSVQQNINVSSPIKSK
ncbi:hypothetical protein [Polynucleobacter sp. 80A-SIGWE]|uniref:hypothetical protein n=1 Tax=Polynucleobacter sp. 80A-SIGWE TaxID=2689100 RepID=UPI001C0BF526|nr:hypothetical protein [Polynucleobacter sp. 80A-SIGWE]MBU3590002.1 hypothetical protein [Polynucleobacter sp. 80A-SIGWE]